MSNENHQESEILVIDDTPPNSKGLIRFLFGSDFQVSVAKDRETAIKQRKHTRPDLVRSDDARY